MLTFYGKAALVVAKGTNRFPEVLSEDGLRWAETPHWKCAAVADKAPHKVRVRGYRDVLLKSASDEARAIIESMPF